MLCKNELMSLKSLPPCWSSPEVLLCCDPGLFFSSLVSHMCARWRPWLEVTGILGRWRARLYGPQMTHLRIQAILWPSSVGFPHRRLCPALLITSQGHRPCSLDCWTQWSKNRVIVFSAVQKRLRRQEQCLFSSRNYISICFIESVDINHSQSPIMLLFVNRIET